MSLRVSTSTALDPARTHVGRRADKLFMRRELGLLGEISFDSLGDPKSITFGKFRRLRAA